MIKSNRSRKYWIKIPFLMLMMVLASDLDAKEESRYQGLLPGEGIELVLENCTSCHSTEIILTNHMSRKTWDKTITWMQREQGLWELSKEVRKKILDYLSKTQGVNINKAVRESSRKNSNQMYEFDYRPNPL